MANETQNEAANAVNTLVESAGKLAQMQVEMVTGFIKTSTSAIEPLSKTSMSIAGNIVNTFNEALQNISAAVAQKK
ncbi:chlorosome envelope protein B [Prosthecochloris sp. GSB1]|uniref:chlorosome envelope protein B n=1 Tax=Prosthecochloris sp. GSB1 TaxID=281093 RepID=UPI000B8CE38D|nr:chlorosome envelope protein B [Prosthecochloris sp. GSB1]ASQ90158.1 chlorosome envelope protein B [Prosthecochloris sp. GSB1]